MNIPLNSVADLGLAVRAVRTSAGVRLDDLAAMLGISKQFVTDLEHGKPTVRLGLVLKVLAELGAPLCINIPATAQLELVELERKGGLPPTKARRVRTTQAPA